MKFGKEFKAQMVPEWQEAYMNYHDLKNLLKELQRLHQKNQKSPTTSFRLQRNLTLVRAFSGLTQRQNQSTTPLPTDVEIEDSLMNSAEIGDSKHCSEYMSTIFKADEGEIELLYFKRLEEELNKVVQFYKSKVEEVMNEAALLNKQMDALIAFRVKVRSPQGFVDCSVEMAHLSLNVANSTQALSATTPSAAGSNRKLF